MAAGAIAPTASFMQLELKTDYAGEKARLTCTGRVVAGPEADALDATLTKLVKEVGTIELDLAGVTFLDSSGIGVLVRNLVRARAERRVLRIAALSPQAQKTLEVTSVLGQFRPANSTPTQVKAGLRVLFVHPSAEVRTFVASLLKGRGAQAQTCASIYDARMLAGAETDLMIVSSEDDSAADNAKKTLRLERDFFARSGDEAAEALIAKINEKMNAAAAG